MKDKVLRLLKASLVFFTVNTYAELGTVVCSQLSMDEVYMAYSEVNGVSKNLHFTALSTENESARDLNRIKTIAEMAIASTRKIPNGLISDELNHWQNEESQSLVADFFKDTNQFVEGMFKEKNQAMASVILEQTGNGLILVGSVHSRGVMQQLLSACGNL